jgi:anti-sigma B factor antagonist
MTINHLIVSESIAVVEISGELDVYCASACRRYLQEIIDSGYVRLILDMRDVWLIDSTGLGVLVDALKHVRTEGRGGLVALVPSGRVMKHIRIVGFNKIFSIFDSPSEAVDAISAGLVADLPSADLQRQALESGWHWFPARIYTSDEGVGRAVEDGLHKIVEAFGMQIVFSFPSQRGSWFREFLLRMKDSTARPTRDEFLGLLQRAIEQQAFDKPQAQIDITQSQAVAILLSALDKTPKGIVQVGSLLVIKVMDTVYVRNLTQLELLYWERNPELFRDPERALQELQRAGDAENHHHGSAVKGTTTQSPLQPRVFAQLHLLPSR